MDGESFFLPTPASSGAEAAIARLPLAVLSVGPDGRVRSCAGGDLELLGLHGTAGRTVEEACAHLGPLAGIVRDATAQELSGQITYDRRTLAVRCAPSGDGGTIALIIDVTDEMGPCRVAEMRADDAAAERDRLQQVIDLLPEGLVIVDDVGRVAMRNRAAADIFRRSSASYEDLPLLRALLGETVERERITLRQSALSLRGRDIPLLVNAAPIRDAEGVVTGAVAVFQDITFIRDLERERADFFEMASHEIRTPITAMRGQVELARRYADRGTPIETIAAALDRADAQVERLVDLVSELLDFTRIQNGRLELEPAAADLTALLAEAAERAQRAHPVRTFDLRCPPLPVFATIDARRVGEVIDELIENAVRYSPGGGDIEVSLSLSEAPFGGRDAVIRVRDEGIGVPEEERERLFEPFYRTQATRAYSGAGIALHISRSIARAHDGDLRMESSGPEGTVFALRLPLEPLPEALKARMLR